jgi:MoaA/NifB/PqqE/SkfB family radical SAM enzyme
MASAWWQKRMRGMPAIEDVYLESAGVCDVGCRFCFSRHSPEPLGLMSRETFLAVSRKLFPYVYTVNFVGYGEPLLNDLLPWMIRVVKSYAREAHLTTNGLSLDEGRICQLIASGVDSVAVSLDGVTEKVHDTNRGRGAFSKTVRNACILKKVKEKMRLEKPLLVIDTILTKANRNEIAGLIELAHRLGAGVVNCAHLQANEEEAAALSMQRQEGFLARDYEAWQSRARSLGVRLRLPVEFGGSDGSGCFWDPRKRLAVAWDGEVRPCCFLLHSNYWYRDGRMLFAEAPRFGNLKEKSFKSIWWGEEYRRFRESVSTGTEWPSPCEPCILRSDIIES